MDKCETIGIITMHRVVNYGSVLQAYALQEYLTKSGHKVEIIDYIYPNKYHLKKQKKSFCYLWLEKLYQLVRKLIYCLLYGGDKEHKDKVFLKKYLNLSKQKFKTQASLKNNPPNYDLYITGSDQVWNPLFTFADDIFMLSFVKENFTKKRIAYAPSITQRFIPEEYKNIFKQNLSKYAYISVRDNFSAIELQSLLNKDVKTVCDPVFLLDSSDYNSIITQSKLKINERYILLYILDYMFNPYPEIVNIITKIKEQYQIPVYLMWRKKNKALSLVVDKSFPVPSVSDFLYLIKNAEFIITTSFHGTAFSILFQKQFCSIISDSVNDTRINDLLKKVELDKNCLNFRDTWSFTPIDYLIKQNKIAHYIKESREFLNIAINN